ncbi:MAG: hypothetical protein M3022_11725 [Actinomycetota bacterium]|nr:hypothetical protein [Actinomycetota bacterium]
MAAGRKRAGVSGLAVGGFTVLAVGCCAAGPVLVGLVAAIGLSAVLAIGAGLVALVVLSTAVLPRYRRRRRGLIGDRGLGS